MNQTQRALACGSFFVAGLLAACGGRQSIASKSAAAYAEAVKKGVPVNGGHEHGGHVASTSADDGGAESDTAGMHDASRPGTQHAASTGATDHSMSTPAPPASPNEEAKK